MEVLNWPIAVYLAHSGLWIVFAVVLTITAFCALRQCILGSGACATFRQEPEQEGEVRHV